MCELKAMDAHSYASVLSVPCPGYHFRYVFAPGVVASKNGAISLQLTLLVAQVPLVPLEAQLGAAVPVI